MKRYLSIVIIGAGPAGLGCAYDLIRSKQTDKKIVIFDKNTIVGGLARTYSYKGCRFDVGPHRFYTKNKKVLQLWQNILKHELIKVKRLTRMLYKNKLFYYPVQLKDVVIKLGLWDSILACLSFLHAKIFFRSMIPKTFEEWIIKQFGKKLYLHFFKTYTEKVWGIPCDKIAAEWASQRIKNLNFAEVVKNAVFGGKTKKAKSLIDTFYYPVKGSGYCYKQIALYIKKNGGKFHMRHQITVIRHDGGKILSVAAGETHKQTLVDHLFSSIPLTHFIYSLRPKPPFEVLEAARNLLYRDHITVNLIIKKQNLFSDNWIYVHAPEVKMARVTNYNNFSDSMTPNKQYSAISVEYFTFKTDAIWNMTNKELIRLAISEMERVRLIQKKDVLDGFVVREADSYPAYYVGYEKYFKKIKQYADTFSNLHLIGRGGMFKYNNMDHSLYSGMLAAQNYLLGYKKYSVWDINEDAEYLEK